MAIDDAQKTSDDIPVGAVLVHKGVVIARAHNEKEKNNDITAHAGIIVLREGAKALGNWRLDECDLYVTLEPCPMCGWAILQSRVNNLYFGSYDLNYGAFSKVKLQDLCSVKINILGGIMEKECDTLLNDFFKKIRNG